MSVLDIPEYDFLTCGETLLRLSPPGMQRLDQARLFEVGIGGTELNVACVLARLGRPGSRGCRKGRSVASSTARRAGMASIRGLSAGCPMRGWG